MKTMKQKSKKVLSVFLAVMMLMSAWVFVAPTEAEAAATLSTYRTADKYGTPYWNGSDVYYSKWKSGSTYTKFTWPKHIYLDVSESLQSAGYYYTVNWLYGTGTDYRTIGNGFIFGGWGIGSGYPTKYYTMTNMFNNYDLDASLPTPDNDGGTTQIYTSSNTSGDLYVGVSGLDWSGAKAIIWRNPDQQYAERTSYVFMMGNPKGTGTGRYSTTESKPSNFGGWQQWSSGWSNKGSFTTSNTSGDWETDCYEGTWKEVAFDITIYDKSTLGATVNEANNIINNLSYKYTIASLNNLKNVLNNNKGVLTTRATTQSNIDTANNNIRNAINALVLEKYDVTFDNLINFRDWNTTSANNGVISSVTNGGFTLISDNGVAEATSTSPFFPVVPGKDYMVDIDIEGEGWDVYIFFCDQNGNWIDFNDGESNRYSSGVAWDSVFTAPNNTNVVKAQIRVDANGKGNATSGFTSNTVTFKNIRVYEAGVVGDGVSYVPLKTFYGGDALGTKLDVPTRTGYTFARWYADNNGNGKYDSSEEVTDGNGNVISSLQNFAITQDWILYSDWTPNKYEVKFVDKNGKTVSSEEYDYGTPASSIEKPANTAADYDSNLHYTYSWPEIKDVGTESVTYTEIKSGSAHKYDQQVVSDTYKAKDATCTSKATYYYSCACGAKGTTTFEYGDKLPHNLTVYHKGKAPTCTDIGQKEYWECNCGTMFIEVNGEKTEFYDMSALDIPRIAHSFNEVVLEKEATCTVPGHRAYKTCKTCNFYFEADADDLSTDKKSISDFTLNNGGHKWNDATCTDPKTCKACGTTDGEAKGHSYTYTEAANGNHTVGCSACNYSATETCVDTDNDCKCDMCKAQLAHKYSSVVTPPTCTDDGFTKYTCSVCNHSYTGNTVPATGHTEGAVVVENNVAADCEKDGSYDNVVYCTVCGAELSRDTVTVPATGHTKGEVVVENNVAANCEKDGSYDNVVYCTVCKKELSRKTVTVPAKGHDMQETSAKVEPKCEVDGKTAGYTCANGCGKTEGGEVIPALKHDWDDGKVTTAATCTGEGVMTYTCKRDSSHKKTEKIDEKGHKSGETVVEKEVAATCTVNGSYDNVVYCTECNTELSRNTVTVTATGHTEGKAVVENNVDPDCENDGSYDNVVYCTVCGAELSRKTETVPATGHTEREAVVENNVDPDCINDGSYDNVVYCSVCGVELSRKTETVPATGHTEGEAVVENEVDSTCYAEGSYDEVVYCSVCAAAGKTEELSRETKTIEKKEHTPAEAVEENKKDSTCYAEGSYDEVVYCSVCAAAGKTEELSRETKTIEKKEHTPAEAVEENKKDSTCYAEGSYDEVVYCSVCAAAGKTEELSRETKTIEKKEHTPAEAVVENQKDSTCYTEGSYDEVVYCSVEACKHEISRYKKTIEKKAHTPAEAVVENKVDSTCYAEGSYDEVVYCSVEACKHEISRDKKTIEKKAHTPAEAVVENKVDSTCYAEGSYDEVVYCSVCAAAGKTEELSRVEKTIEKKAHTPAEAVEENKKDSTCYAEGSYDEVVYCSVCAAAGKTEELSRVEKTIEKKEHTPAGAVRENEADSTCYAEGSYDEVVYCSVCAAAGKTEELSRETKTIEKKAHTPAGAVVENEVDATCTEAGSYDEVVYCSVCAVAGKKEELSRETFVVPATGHSMQKTADEIPATCKPGKTAVYTCANGCGKTEGGEEIPANGKHTVVVDAAVEATCKLTGLTEGSHCSACGEVLEAQKVIPTTDHKPVRLAPVEATCTEDGYTEGYSCENCSEVLVAQQIIPAHGHKIITHEGYPATCQTAGLTDFIYCDRCGTVIQDATKIPQLECTDSNRDGFCDFCGDTLKTNAEGTNCSCICHKQNGLMKFIYKILRFFWKLFKIEQYCDCGNAAHW